jgi:hypothetical protein
MSGQALRMFEGDPRFHWYFSNDFQSRDSKSISTLSPAIARFQ